MPRIRFEVEGFQCTRCVTPDTLVIVDDGVKPINSLKVGDNVLTHKGRFRPITQIFKHPHTGKVYTISTQGNNITSTLTGEHPIFTRILTKSGMKNNGSYYLTTFSWTTAKELAQQQIKRHIKQDVIVFPRYNEVYDSEIIETVIQFRKTSTIYSLPANADLMKVIGYWLAEGSIGKNPRRGIWGIIYYFGKNLREYLYAQDVCHALMNLGLHPSLYMSRGLWVVQVSDARLARCFDRWFGNSASTKKIPLWLKRLSTEKLDTLLRCYLNGDGYSFKADKYMSVSISLDLIIGLQQIASKIGYSTRLHKDPKREHGVICGRNVNLHEKYRLIISDRFMGQNHLRNDRDYLYFRSKGITISDYVGPVYNLEVAEDNSYCTPFLAIHNCGHRWVPRDMDSPPANCPNKKCKSPYWQTERGVLSRGRKSRK